MTYLLLTTLIWGFSFPLIGIYLKGVDSFLVASIRLGLACLCFIPFHRGKLIPGKERRTLMCIGAVQYGIMYVCYLRAYAFAPAYVVALFSSFTPIWICAIAACKKPTSLKRLLAAGFLATLGATLIKVSDPVEGNPGVWMAFALMQLSNLSFGAGQLMYRGWKLKQPERRELESFCWMYVGGFGFTLLFLIPSFLLGKEFPVLEPIQIGVILYLGVIASGLCFFLWNVGASRVSTGTLAAANNLLVPFGVVLSILFKKEYPHWGFFLLGSAVIAFALMLAPKEGERGLPSVETP